MLPVRKWHVHTFDVNRSQAKKKSTELNVKKFPECFHCLPREINSISRKHDWTSRRFSRLHYCENNRSSQFARLYVYIGEIWTRQSTGGTGFSELQWLIKTARRISLRQSRCYWSEAINRLIRGLLNLSDFRRGSRLAVRRELVVGGKLLLMKKSKKETYISREATHLRAVFIQNCWKLKATTYRKLVYKTYLWYTVDSRRVDLSRNEKGELYVGSY